MVSIGPIDTSEIDWSFVSSSSTDNADLSPSQKMSEQVQQPGEQANQTQPGLADLGTNALALLGSPVNFVRGVFFAILFGAVFDIANFIRLAFDRFIQGLGRSGEAVVRSLETIFLVPINAVDSLVTSLSVSIAAELGIAAFPVTASIWIIVIALAIRIGSAQLLAVADLAGSIPVVGGLISSLVTFAVELVGGVGDD